MAVMMRPAMFCVCKDGGASDEKFNMIVT